MSNNLDPGLWEKIAGFEWAALLIPIGYVWKRVTGAVQKDDFSKYAEEVKDIIKAHAEADEKSFDRQRDTMIKIFEKLDEQGTGITRIETKLEFLQEKNERG